MRYHGGKWLLAPWIIGHFPPHRTYVEPFGGAGSVLMRKPRAYTEVYNDLWDTVVNVFRLLRDPEKAQELCRQLELTPFARTEFLGAIPDTGNEIEDARRVIFRSFAGFGPASMNASHATGFRSNSSRSHTIPAHNWANYPKQISAFVERLRGVVIENRPAADVMRQHDSEETLFYLDPPYVQETRSFRRRNAAYHHEMTDEDHRELAEIAHSVRGGVIVSGYHSALYEELYSGWRKSERGCYADGAKSRREVLWLSPGIDRMCGLWVA